MEEANTHYYRHVVFYMPKTDRNTGKQVAWSLKAFEVDIFTEWFQILTLGSKLKVNSLFWFLTFIRNDQMPAASVLIIIYCLVFTYTCWNGISHDILVMEFEVSFSRKCSVVSKFSLPGLSGLVTTCATNPPKVRELAVNKTTSFLLFEQIQHGSHLKLMVTELWNPTLL